MRKEQQARLEEEVQKATDQLGQTRAELRALSAYLINAQEVERRRLARELHDDFGQRTALLGMRINRAIEHLYKDPKEIGAILENLSGEISQLTLGLREVSHRLHPSILEDLGVVPVLRIKITGFRDDGIDVSFSLPDEIPAMTADAVTALFRISQEALTNTLKHARATGDP